MIRVDSSSEFENWQLLLTVVKDFSQGRWLQWYVFYTGDRRRRCHQPIKAFVYNFMSAHNSVRPYNPCPAVKMAVTVATQGRVELVIGHGAAIGHVNLHKNKKAFAFRQNTI